MKITTRIIFSCLMLLNGFENFEGKLIFQNPLHEPRVYEKAPSGIHVTTVHAYDPTRKTVTYNLLDVREHLYFNMDSTSGNISTAKNIDKKVGDTYEIIAVAISQGETKLRQLQITVTEFNVYPPEFEHDLYRGELHVRSKVGSTVLRVRAKDADAIPYNAEVYYKLDDPEDPKGRFVIDPQTGVLTLARSLESGTSEPVIELGVVSVDGGSPKRTDYAKIEVLIKTISEPRNVRSTNATGSTVQVCWSRPEFGQVLGYIIKYREVENPHEAPSFLNITSDAMSKCSTLVELKPWTDYEYRIYGWNRFETGQGSTVGRFGTRPDYCQMNICQHGECHILNEEPGYHCDCKQGYYGDVCDKFNPCSLEPCENFGKCQNISSHKYRCECLPGFSGQNCSDFNPCAIRPSPCLHGGRCESTASHKYQCYCTKGYYGKTCQFFDPCSLDPCRNGAKCQNATQEEYICRCMPGYTGKQCETDIDECSSSPCKHGATCRDLINSFHCRCAPGYKGKRCHLIEHCPPHTLHSNKGVFRWNSTSHGRAQLIECPFGSTYPDRESATGFAKRRCYLLSNGSVAWGQTDLSSCREEGFKNAEKLTEEYWILTEDPKHLNIERLQVATKQIEGVLDYAIYDKKIAHNMLSIVSNLLAINESLLWIGDFNGSTTARITDLVDRFASEVNLAKGEDIVLVTENLVVRAVSWDPEINGLNGEDLTFSVHYQARKRRENDNKGRYKPLPPSKTFWEEMNEEKSPSFYNDAELTIPTEALFLAQNQSYQELRIKFVAYKNDKFFRERPTARWKECYDSHNYRKRYNCFYTGTSGFSGRRVLQASVLNATITNLSSPLTYVLPSPTNVKVFCAYWQEQERSWSTEGLITNQSGNSTTCLAFHMTSFSLLLDPTPYEGINTDHLYPLSMISYIGCGLSMLGLILTIITYSIFRCLNKDHQGQILIHQCIAMLMMNAVFIIGTQRRLISYEIDVCATVAVLIHYFTLSSLAWMCVEAINMYRLLSHVFASTEAHFMLKRAILAWGIPFVIVGTTVLMDWEVYLNQNEFCMLNAENPYVYYISFLGPACIILFINLVFFLMITKVLFCLKNDSIKKTSQSNKKDKGLVPKAHIRGAFMVMVLLGVSWVFGAFAIGEIRLIFQYVFSVSNSLQGFLIFLVRCLMYPEARSAWYQLFITGSFKKCQGIVPQGSWSAKSGHNKENGLTTNTRIGSTDMNDTVAFNTNAFWGEKGSLPSDIITSVREDCCNTAFKSSLPTIPSDMVLDYSPSQRGSAQLLTFSNSGNTLRSYKDEQLKDNASVKSIRSVSKHDEKTGSLSGAGTPCSNYSTGKTSTISEEASKRIGSEKHSTSEIKCEVEVSKDIEFSSLPVEIQGRSSYDSSHTYLDERSEQSDRFTTTTLGRNVNAPKTSNIFASELDKLNSWPRTLSSFAGGKENDKSVSSMNSANQKHLQKLTDVYDYNSCQVIPLQNRPTTSSISPSFSPSVRTGDCHHFNVSVNSPMKDTPEKFSGHLIHHPLHQHHPVISDKHSVDVPYRIPTTYPTTPLKYHFGDNISEKKSIASVKSGDSGSLESYGEVVLSPDQDTMRIWEIQEHISRNETLLEDSESSKL